MGMGQGLGQKIRGIFPLYFKNRGVLKESTLVILGQILTTVGNE